MQQHCDKNIPFCIIWNTYSYVGASQINDITQINKCTYLIDIVCIVVKSDRVFGLIKFQLIQVNIIII